MRKGLMCATLLALAASGCEVEVTFNPIGNDVSLSGSWTINGETPNATNCGAAGISHVAVAFFDKSGGTPLRYDQLTFDCAAGMFDTGGPVLARGSYTTQWVAYDSSFVEVGRGPMITLDVTDPSIAHANLLPADFVTETPMFNPHGSQAELTGDWTVDGTAPSATNCMGLGVDQVAIVAYDANDTGLMNGVVMGMAACSSGKFDSMPMKILAAGNYLFTYRGLATDGMIVAESQPFDADGDGDPDPLVVTTQTRVMLAPVDFVSEATLELNMGWDTDPTGVMADADCATAGVMTMTYTLNVMGMPTNIIDMQTDVMCDNVLQFHPIADGEYSLYAEGADSMGVKHWMGTCDMLVVDGGVETYDCFFDKS